MTTDASPADEAQTSEAEQDDEPPPMSIGRRLQFSLITLLLLLTGAELGLRLLGLPSGNLPSPHTIKIQDEATFERCVGMWRPGYKGRLYWPKELAFELSINQLGLRGPEVSLDRKPGLTRILCVGDSTTFCIYTDDADTWPRRLEGLLRKDGLAVEVINGGSPGWSTTDQLRFLRERALPKLKPDLILHMFCANDPIDIRDEDGTRGKYARQLARVRSSRLGYRMRDFLSRHTALGELEIRVRLAIRKRFERQWKPGEGPNGKPLEAIPEPAWERYGRVYGKLVALCRDQKIPLVTMAFPHHPVEGPDVFDQAPRVEHYAKLVGVPTISLGDFRRSKDLDGLYNLPWDLHANAKGNIRLAELIHSGLRRLGLPKRP